MNHKKATDTREYSKEGFVISEAIITKSGPLPYTRQELGLDGEGVIMLDRPKDVLRKALPSMRGLPVTRGHPKEFVDTHNIRDHIIGAVISEPTMDDEGQVRASVRLYDDDAIKSMEMGEHQLSPGFTFVPTFKDDHTGTINQAAFNHVALLPNGRAGEAVRLLDHLPPSIHSMENIAMNEDQKKLVDAITAAVKEAVAIPASKATDSAEVEKRLVDSITTQLSPIVKDVAELKAQKATDEAKAKAKKAEEETEKKVGDAVKAERARAALVQDAKPFIAEDKHESLNDMDIKDVLRLAIGDTVKGTDSMDLATLNGVFMGVKATKAEDKADDPTRSVAVQKETTASDQSTLIDIAQQRFNEARGIKEAK